MLRGIPVVARELRRLKSLESQCAVKVAAVFQLAGSLHERPELER